MKFNLFWAKQVYFLNAKIDIFLTFLFIYFLLRTTSLLIQDWVFRLGIRWEETRHKPCVADMVLSKIMDEFPHGISRSPFWAVFFPFAFEWSLWRGYLTNFNASSHYSAQILNSDSSFRISFKTRFVLPFYSGFYSVMRPCDRILQPHLPSWKEFLENWVWVKR
jgi:hypothetical protein